MFDWCAQFCGVHHLTVKFCENLTKILSLKNRHWLIARLKICLQQTKRNIVPFMKISSLFFGGFSSPPKKTTENLVCSTNSTLFSILFMSQQQAPQVRSGKKQKTIKMDAWLTDVSTSKIFCSLLFFSTCFGGEIV